MNRVVDVDELADAVVSLGEVSLDFGRVNRITFHADGVTPESDTTHTVMLALIASALAEEFFRQLDGRLVAQFALVHDLVEVFAGDTPTLRALTTEQKRAKKESEHLAAQRLRVMFEHALPWLPGTLDAYEQQILPEARFVRALDKALPKITHLLNGAVTLYAQGVTRDELAARYLDQGAELQEYAGDFPLLLQLRAKLVDRVLDGFDHASRPAPRRAALVTFMVTGDGEQGHPMNSVTRRVDVDEHGNASPDHLAELSTRIGAHVEAWARRHG